MQARLPADVKSSAGGWSVKDDRAFGKRHTAVARQVRHRTPNPVHAGANPVRRDDVSIPVFLLCIATLRKTCVVIYCGFIAHSVERRVRNEEVPGAKPGDSTIFCLAFKGCGTAQCGHLNGIENNRPGRNRRTPPTFNFRICERDGITPPELFQSADLVQQQNAALPMRRWREQHPWPAPSFRINQSRGGPATRRVS